MVYRFDQADDIAGVLLADGMEVRSADLSNGMLCIDLVRLVPDRLVRRIEIGGKPVSD